LISVDVSSRFDFFLACRLLFGQLAENGKTTMKLRLPQQFPLYMEDGQYELNNVSGWFSEQTADLARQFDARNGNDFFRKQITKLPEMKKWRQALPLPASSVG